TVMKHVILDALIKREDFDITDDITTGGIGSRNKTTLSVEDLRYNSFFFSALRKPDFQRETNEWTPEKIVSLVDSFLNSELIPAIILWKNSKGYIFAIDGAHRLSCLSAWINDDYGDGEISLKYYDNYIPEEQRQIAKKTRIMINEKIGSFNDILNATNESTCSDKIKEIANNLGSLALQVQWVEGDSKTAEESFLKINQSATKISGAELELIKNRSFGHAIASRAIIRAGRGHNYWSSFEDKDQKKVIEIAKEVHKLLFRNEEINVDDISSYPIGGIPSSTYALDVVTQTVLICNGIKKSDFNSNSNEGNARNVIQCLNRVRDILRYINSKHACSLGLHPFVYFYSDIGKHKIGSFYGILQLFVDINKKPEELNKFIENRERLEEILLKYSFLVQQIIRKWRQSKRGFSEVTTYYKVLINILNDNKELTCEQTIDMLRKNDDFKYLQTEITDTAKNSNFSRGQKKQVKINALVEGLPKCAICSGYISMYSSSIDHIVRKRDGGDSSMKNSQLTHLYCNTTYKN
ncbi:MAG: DUF262 domain-containing protein, partial [Oscillospiraceae bacterium]|nr:DUF262 domain-containing protein [Oscillospiraceae bacterium]